MRMLSLIAPHATLIFSFLVGMNAMASHIR